MHENFECEKYITIIFNAKKRKNFTCNMYKLFS